MIGDINSFVSHLVYNKRVMQIVVRIGSNRFADWLLESFVSLVSNSVMNHIIDFRM